MRQDGFDYSNCLAFLNSQLFSTSSFIDRPTTLGIASKDAMAKRRGRASYGQQLRSSRSRYNSRNSRKNNPQAAIDPFLGPPVIEPPAPSTLPSNSVSIIWFRNDLRVRDHAALALANTASLMIPVYVFDTSKFGRRNASPWGFQRNGPFRTVFLIESVTDLRNTLRICGSDMVLRQGDPVEELLKIARAAAEKDMGPIYVVAHKETTWEETKQEKALQRGLKALSVEFEKDIGTHWVWGSTLHHLQDIPFNAGGPAVPATITAYRMLIEAQDGPKVRPEIEMPETFISYPFELELKSDPVPSLKQDLKVQGLCDPHDHAFPNPLAAMDFVGGHTAGEERVNEYIWLTTSLDNYKETRNDSGKRNCSSKFSPWLALGCLSPRTIYWQCKEFEEKFVANDSTYWMVIELIHRDYFRWISASVGTKLFSLNGYSGRGGEEGNTWNLPKSTITKEHRERLQRWIEGNTGVPFIDTNMRELAATGYMSNRGRQNVGSFLLHDLEFPDWRAGAEYFESTLIDHDVASNWGNWAFLAGVGSDPRSRRKLNVIEQSMKYDEEGWFITRWCPEIQDIPPPMVHQPHTLSTHELEDFEIEEGVTYPKPIVSMPTFNPEPQSSDSPDFEPQRNAPYETDLQTSDAQEIIPQSSAQE